jgi:hypothetical protein
MRPGLLANPDRLANLELLAVPQPPADEVKRQWLAADKRESRSLAATGVGSKIEQ